MELTLFERLRGCEQFILTICANGYGKISSAYDYRRTGRGGQGITNIDNVKRNGPVVASFPASKADQLMLVTDQAKMIRTPLASLRIISRNSAGVRIFNVADDEHVVSAARIDEEPEPEDAAEAMVAEELAEVTDTAPADDGSIGDDAAAGPEDGE
jgi:DNA gyrase subunit A